MAISKKFLKAKPVCKVTFSFSAPEANEVFLVGNFNNWNAGSLPLKKNKSGDFKVTVDLDINTSYEYKFVVDGNYLNDQEADSYIYNEFAGSENSVVSV